MKLIPIKNICLVLGLFVYNCGVGHAQNFLSTAVPFLRISPDARSGGMGDVGLATSPDANSSLWNQAKIPFAKDKIALGVTYTPWLDEITKDVYMAALGGYGQIDEEQALSASLRYFNLGNIQYRDISGNVTGDAIPREFSFDAGYSRKLSKRTSIGGALRLIYSKLLSGVNYKPGVAVAADLSIFHTRLNTRGQGFAMGLAISNMGSKIGYTSDARTKEFLPTNLGMGVTYTSVLNDDLKLSFALDINKLLVPALTNDSASIANYHNYGVLESWFKSFGNENGGGKSLQGSFGMELNYVDLFFARLGYYREGESMGGRRYFSMGAGLKYNIAGLDFSYLIPSDDRTTRNPLSNTLRVGLTFDLSKKQVQKEL